MCGVFGWISKDGGQIDIKTLRRIAVITERRGPHAWGLAWLDRNGQLHMYKQTGQISHSLKRLAMARDAVALIGHTRWATQGDPAWNDNNHPHQCLDGWYVHNGRIPTYDQILSEYGITPRTECDSEVIGHLVERHDSPNILDRCIEASELVATVDYAMLGLWPSGDLVTIRMGKPLHIGQTRKGTWLASLATGLPGAQPLRDFTGRVFRVSA
jgi:glucosamine 6-phosphate synthetase-like amidotransferase/phosphosugar isomerase protein